MIRALRAERPGQVVCWNLGPAGSRCRCVRNGAVGRGMGCGVMAAFGWRAAPAVQRTGACARYRADDVFDGADGSFGPQALFRTALPRIPTGKSTCRASQTTRAAPGSLRKGVRNRGPAPVGLRPRYNSNMGGSVGYADFVGYAPCLTRPGPTVPAGDCLNMYDLHADPVSVVVDCAAPHAVAGSSTGRSSFRFPLEDSERDMRALSRPERPVNSPARGADICHVV